MARGHFSKTLGLTFSKHFTLGLMGHIVTEFVPMPREVYTDLMSVNNLLNLFGNRLRTLPILILYLTDGCNSRCAMCDIWRSPRRNMAPEFIDAVSGEIAALHTRWVVLSGGEAMQHPDWPNIAARLRREGAKVILLTNGLFLQKQAQDVINNVDEVVVSLDGGTAATYKAIRGVDAFQLVLDGIAAVRAGGVPVTTRTTVQQANFREIPQIIDAAKSVDATLISFLSIDVANPYAFGPRFADGLAIPVINAHEPPAGALSLEEVAALSAIYEDVFVHYQNDFERGLIAESPAKLRQMVRYFQAVDGESSFPPVRCNAPHTSMVIEVDGTVRPCYFLPQTGKWKADTSLRDQINSDAAVAMRKAYRNGERPECARCVCPLYKDARALIRL